MEARMAAPPCKNDHPETKFRQGSFHRNDHAEASTEAVSFVLRAWQAGCVPDRGGSADAERVLGDNRGQRMHDNPVPKLTMRLIVWLA